MNDEKGKFAAQMFLHGFITAKEAQGVIQND